MTTLVAIPRTKTDRFLVSFQSVVIRPEHRNHGDETPCLRDCGIPPVIASRLIHWAENVVGEESLVCTFEYRGTGRNLKTWHWMPEFLRDAFRKHTELFGDSDLPDAAKLMRDTGSCWPSPVLAAKVENQEFQWRVQPWLLHCFGPEVAADRRERNHRFIEESVELAQSLGCTASEAHQLVDYVFGRPVGEPAQEVGGVMVTLAALCLANSLDMHVAGDVELARVSEPAMTERLRVKQASRPKHSPLPGSYPEFLGSRKEITMEAAFEAQYQRDWNDPSGDEMKAVWSASWLAAKGTSQKIQEGQADERP